MIAYDATSGARPTVPRPRPDELAVRYTAYRRRHAARLMHLLPRAAIRPLYRRARDARSKSSNGDPLEMLIGFCETLLPLPPFDVWERDLRAHPEAHLRDLDESPEAPTAEAPSTVEVRTFDHAGSEWWALLKSFREASVWRGYIEFEDAGSGRVSRTALIFSESDPAALRERFLTFENAALEAFLRSTLP